MVQPKEGYIILAKHHAETADATAYLCLGVEEERTKS
jgi:hypothetical protein